MRKLVLMGILLSCSALFAQTVQVSRENKTIAITADDSVSVDADMAILSLGYENYGVTEREVYDNNLKVSTRIVKAILGAGVKEGVIHTSKITVESVDPEKEWSPEDKRQRKYQAHQSWEITVPVAQAQKLVDLAMLNGVNKLEDVKWQFSNLPELQAKASGAALAKAKMIADQMAQGLGAKLGSLVFASNSAPVLDNFLFWRQYASNMVVNTEAATVSSRKEIAPTLRLFPDKVKQSATVHAVFAIE